MNDRHFNIGDLVDCTSGGITRGIVIDKARSSGDLLYRINTWPHWIHGFNLRLVTTLDLIAEIE